LASDNTRKGFFEREQFDAVLKYLPTDLKPVAETAYITGWRIHSEILTRQRHHVNLKAGWLRLEPEQTKNRQGRNFPLVPGLREILQAQIERTEALERAEGRITSSLFHREALRPGHALVCASAFYPRFVVPASVVISLINALIGLIIAVAPFMFPVGRKRT
jgi:hypothetical protein